MTLPQVYSPEQLTDLVVQLGFLPFFAGPVPGLSVEECCPAELWFSNELEGPWEWKGPVIRSGRCLYGKLYGGRAGFVSRDWFPDLANLRRDGYDFDARYDDGLASRRDKDLYDAVAARGLILSKALKQALGLRRGQNSGFETAITRLQMQTYLTVSDFVYMRDKHGKTYGWGVAQYATPEALFGPDLAAYHRSPEESRARILAHLSGLLPGVSEKSLLKLTG